MKHDIVYTTTKNTECPCCGLARGYGTLGTPDAVYCLHCGSMFIVNERIAKPVAGVFAKTLNGKAYE